MRELTGHRVNPANDKLKITVVDEPGADGANHLYEITGFDADRPNPSMPLDTPLRSMAIVFQNGPIPEAGVNGVTHEALLEIVADRLIRFQEGPYACDENAKALMHLLRAQSYLQARTKARMTRGVEGTHTI